MRTTEDVLTTILDQKATEFQQKVDTEPADRYHDAILKAVGIVQARTLKSNDNGTWDVWDTETGSGQVWVVNGQCACKAALKDKTQTKAAKGICKHRIAVKLARQVNQWFTDHHAQQHAHACLGCQSVYTCWEEPCHETKHLTQCDACDRTKEETLMHDHPTHTTDDEGNCYGDCLACLQEFHDTRAQQPQAEEELDSLTNLSSTITAEELATLAQPPYEVNPQTLCPTCKIDLTLIDHASCRAFEASVGQPANAPQGPVTTLPEAPASLNLKVKKGAIEVMFTMRATTDQEILDRLPAALAGLEAALGVKFDANGK